MATPASRRSRQATAALSERQLVRSEWGRPEGLPTEALEEIGNLTIVHRRKRALQAPCLLKHPARSARCVEEQRTPGFGTRVLPGMGDAARYEGTSTGTAGCDLIVDLEGKLSAQNSAQNIDQLVAVIMEVKG